MNVTPVILTITSGGCTFILGTHYLQYRKLQSLKVTTERRIHVRFEKNEGHTLFVNIFK